MMEKWIVEWHDPKGNKGWIKSWEVDTEAKAQKQLAEDEQFFYKHIQIRLVHWVGDIVLSTQGRS